MRGSGKGVSDEGLGTRVSEEEGWGEEEEEMW